MTIYERSRAINGAASKDTRKDVNLTILQRSFAKHFKDSIDYQPATLVNGITQQLLVSRNKSVVTEKLVRAYPGDTLPLGGVVDCFGCKWLITEIDPNRELCVSAKMEQCNQEVCWQNPETKAIHKRWCTMSKPYFSNLEQNKKTTISQREYKMQIPYDEETALIDVDKRFMLEFIGKEPKTYRVTCVDTMTERYQLDGSIQGFLIINLEQDQYIAERDNIELMICDYIVPTAAPEEQSITPVIAYSGDAEIKMGGSAKVFTASFVRFNKPVDRVPVWTVDYLDAFNEYLTVSIEDNVLSIQADYAREMEGAVVKITLTDSDKRYQTNISCKVVTLI